ncbi:MAG: threonine synthase [Erysipelotrichaceae bacterium]
MLYESTRNAQIKVSSIEAILQGLASDGGLFFPRELPKLPSDVYSTTDFKKLAVLILKAWFDDFSKEEIVSCVHEAYTDRFDTEEIVPLVKVGDTFVAELFHGPTAAFKDIALSLFPRLLVKAREKSGDPRDLVILAATSGDTGSAALCGLKDLPHIKIITFYPDFGISKIQRLQMTTQDGKNQKVAAIQGNFDDAQNAVKHFFATRDPLDDVLYSSANSINIGRLLPQIVYYVQTYNRLVRQGVVKQGSPVDFAVPTGNFGNILAGYLAKATGLPIGKLICASNKNHILSDFLETGVYDRNRAFHSTLSPSMDILISSNLERLIWLLSDGDSTLIARLMDELAKTGKYILPKVLFSKLKETFVGGFADDAETLHTIREVYTKNAYLLDPHTAVAWHVAQNQPSINPVVVLATASPYKFPASIASAMGWEIEDDLALIEKIQTKTGILMPACLASLKLKPIVHTDVLTQQEVDAYIRRVAKELP